MNGHTLSLAWILPFLGILLSIALCPLFMPRFWHRHFGKVSVFWLTTCVGAMVWTQGIPVAVHEILHTYIIHFLPFIILIGTLYILSAHIKLTIKGTATPTFNTVFLGIACLCANFLGTVGAAMIFIKPFLSVNEHRVHKTHSMVFFIFLVCNIGGCLTAIGDPPLFLGFLNGVEFFWPLKTVYLPFSIMVLSLLTVYWMIDFYYARQEKILIHAPFHVSLKGLFHIILLMMAILLIIFSGFYQELGSFSFLGLTLKQVDICRDVGLCSMAYLSYWKGKKEGSEPLNKEPLIEVMYLFAGIFMTAAPVLTMLQAGATGPLGFLVSLVSTPEGHPLPMAYFWMTGVLSAFLDNAPTYLIFYNLMGQSAEQMMTTFSKILAAISMGSVFMGAMTYIGNAPNFMVKSLAEANHIKMPNFLHYMGWSLGILGPLLFLVSFML